MNKLNEENIPSLSEADVQLLFDNTVYNDDELARALFHRPAKYVIDTCNNCWLEDRNYFMERLVLRTCFMKRNTSWSNARLNPGAYLLGIRESANAMRREGKPLMDWYLDVKECLEYMEQNGYARPFRKQAFFESINRHFADANEIKQIAMDENLTDDQKCKKLWERDYNTFIYSGLLNMQTYSKLPHEMKEKLYNSRQVMNNVSLARRKVFDYKSDFGIQEFCLTHDSGEYEPLTVDESFMIYSERDPSGNTPYNRYNQYHNKNWKEHYDIITWWDYIKKSIETYEEYDILKTQPRKQAFFENLTVEKFNNLDNNLIKRVILKYVKNNGYIRGDYGYNNRNGSSYRSSPTVAAIISLLDNNSENLESIACPQEDLDKMNNWVNNINIGDSQQYREYYRRALEAWNTEHLVKNDLSIICSFCNTYFLSEKRAEHQREREQREREHQLQVQSSSNEHAGQVGDVISFIVAEAHIVRWITPSYYAPKDYPVWEIKDVQGKTYVWSDTKNNLEIKPGMIIEGKIKELLSWRGFNKTKIWRLKVLKQNSDKNFFS